MEPSNRDIRTNSGRSLSVTDQCELLSNRRRQRLLSYLMENANTAIAIDRLITHLQSVEADAESENIRLALEHLHLPKLEQAGLITYTSDGDAVEYHPHDQFEELFAFLEERE